MVAAKTALPRMGVMLEANIAEMKAEVTMVVRRRLLVQMTTSRLQTIYWLITLLLGRAV